MRNASFRQKLVALLVSAIVLAGGATMVAVLVNTEETIQDNVEAQLLVARSVFERLMDQRFIQMSDAVRVLAADFGFKKAAATGDEPTIVSALENHLNRADANVAVLIGLNGKAVASTSAEFPWSDESSWRQMVRRLRTNDYLAQTISGEGQAYQVVAVPVMTPRRSAWLLMGFSVDDAIAKELKAITGLDVSLVTATATDRGVVASSLSATRRHALTEVLGTSLTSRPGQLVELDLGEEQFLTLVQPLSPNGESVHAVLQQSLTTALEPFRVLRLELLALFAVILTLVVASGVRVARTLTVPIQRLMEAASRIGDGDYETVVTVRSSDELGALERTLNSMRLEISDRERRIIHQASHDDLTGLPNRHSALRRIDEAIARAATTGTPFSLAVLDIIRFKQINDTLGHDIGDHVLNEVAARLQNRVRETDLAARLDGDEFLLLLQGASAESSVGRIANDLEQMLHEPIRIDEVSVRLTLSAGVASYPEHGETSVTLLRRAEIATGDAKASQTPVVVYEEGRDERHLRQLAIVSDLPLAIERGDLSVHYQPQIDAKDSRRMHAEALVRWHHTRFGNLRPDEFIPVLEQSGNIAPLTEMVLSSAVKQCRTWHEMGYDIRVSVNLSALDLMNPSLSEQLASALKQSNLAARALVLEVTESAIMSDPQRAIQQLEKFRREGHVIALDDFGTGYSSLAQLRQLPVDELKIDKSFVQQLAEQSEDALIVKSTIDLAHGMQLDVVAEGVETEEGRAFLTRCGCERLQGFLISKPLTAADFTDWLAAHGSRTKKAGQGLKMVEL